MIGKTLLHYKILAKLGEGGMGVVYEAEDTKLNRQVAIKFLPRHITASDEERDRFKIEARAAAALNHNNIATIHAIEESDEETFIVMEYIRGRELKDKIEAGPLAIDDTLNLAIQIARGLQAAHEAGVIHRDIKSANIMLSDKGDVRIMDFGLAKLGGQTKLTKEGTTLGTIAYMSPEQTKGDEVDQRSDLFSLGVLIYEMICGQLPFKGDYDQAVAYSILNEDPEPVSGLRSGVPLEFERIVNKCLDKDVTLRYQRADDLIADLSKLKKDSDTQHLLSQSGAKAIAAPKARARVPIPVIIFLTLLIAIAGYFIYTLIPQSKAPIRLTNPKQLTSGSGVEKDPTWSPDGGRLAYTSIPGHGKSDIWVVQLGGRQTVNLTSNIEGNNAGPAWSPDGTQIAFWSTTNVGRLQVMPAVGGLPSNLGMPGSNPLPRYFAPYWHPDSKKLTYVVRDTLDKFFVETLALDSREKEKLRLPGKNIERGFLSVTADGRAIAYVDAVSPDAQTTQIWVLRTQDGEGFPITDGLYDERSPIWSRDGSILYFTSNRGGSRDLWQMPIGINYKPSGSGQPITAGIGMQQAVFSPDGTKLAYVKGQLQANLWRMKIPGPTQEPITWASAEQITFDNALIEFVDVSKDGQTVYFSSDRLGNQDIWRMQADGTGLQQLTSDPTPDWNPMVSPDGMEIVFYAYRSGNRDIWVMPVQGGVARQITSFGGPDLLPAWSPDGRAIAFTSVRSGMPEVWLVPATGGSPQMLANPFTDELTIKWSPDRQVASMGVSTDRGIWVAPSQDENPRRLPKTNDVQNLVWAPDGKFIYFVARSNTQELQLWEISPANGQKRQLTALEGRYGMLAVSALATDGLYLYFSWREDTGDLWVMDVEGE